jgi:hypothetical protein
MQDVNPANLLGIEGSYLEYGAGWQHAFNKGGIASPYVANVSSSGVGSSGGASAGDIVAGVALDMAALLNEISNLSDIAKRQALAQNFRQKVLLALQAAGFTANPGGSADKIVVNGRTFDIIASLNTPGAQVSAQYLLVQEGSGSQTQTTYSAMAGASASSIVFSVGKEQNGLLSQINAAATMEERLSLAVQLRDKVVAALDAAGFNAVDLGKADKISINGVAYDILSDINTLGASTSVQMLRIDGAGQSPGSSSDPRSSILAAGAAHAGIIAQISASYSLEERRSLGTQLQSLVAEKLRSAGFTVETMESPDKIIVNGVTYDFIRSLNSPGAKAAIQTLLVV